MPANKNKNKLILVTGATGHQGGAVLRHLREKGFACRAMTRDPGKLQSRTAIGHGVEVVRGDMEIPVSLARALDGVYGVFAVQTVEAGVEAEIRQGINLADAAKRARITHFVYSSVASADQRTGIPHFDSKFLTEEHIRATGMHFTIVRPVFFMENWLGMRQAIENGALALPLDLATRLQMIAVDDIGGIVAMAFEHPGKWQDRVFEIAGDELPIAELVLAFSRAAGREMTIMYRWFQDTGFRVDISAMRQEYPRLTTSGRLAELELAYRDPARHKWIDCTPPTALPHQRGVRKLTLPLTRCCAGRMIIPKAFQVRGAYERIQLDRQRRFLFRGCGRSYHSIALYPAGESQAQRTEVRLRPRTVWVLYRASGRPADSLLHHRNLR